VSGGGTSIRRSVSLTSSQRVHSSKRCSPLLRVTNRWPSRFNIDRELSTIAKRNAT